MTLLLLDRFGVGDLSSKDEALITVVGARGPSYASMDATEKPATPGGRTHSSLHVELDHSL